MQVIADKRQIECLKRCPIYFNFKWWIDSKHRKFTKKCQYFVKFADIMAKAKSKVQINNKRASYDYEFLEQYDAGVVLVGTEIKSLRAGKASLQDAFCYFVNGELYVKGMNIAPYFWASWGGHDPERDRKLLLT